jgi:hypothetical protein
MRDKTKIFDGTISENSDDFSDRTLAPRRQTSGKMFQVIHEKISSKEMC